MASTAPKAIRRMQIARESELPKDVCQTPGGTLFGTTPGGSKIVYDRLYLLKVRDSPASHTPPVQLSVVPGVTLMPGQAQKEAQVAAAAGKGDAHETKKENNGATMESVQEQPTEEEDLEME